MRKKRVFAMKGIIVLALFLIFNCFNTEAFGEVITVTNGSVEVTRSTIDETLDAAIVGTFNGAVSQDKVTVGIRGYLINTGTANSDDGAHSMAGLFLAEDTVDGQQEMYALEARINERSTVSGIKGSAALALANFQGTEFNGSLYSLEVRAEAFLLDGITPLYEGLGIGIYIPEIIGFAGKYGIFSKEAIRADSNLWIYDSTGANYGLLYKGLGGDLVIESDNDAVNFTDNAISTSGQVTTGELYIKLYVQTTEPTIAADGCMIIWIDTDDSYRTWLVFRRGSGDQLKVELS